MNATLNKRLHAVLAAHNLTGEKKEYAIYGFTNGRTSSSKDLTDAEAQVFISKLEEQIPKAHDPTKADEPQGSLNPLGIAQGMKFDKWGKPIPNPEAEPMRRYMLKLGYEKGKDPKFTKGWCERQGVNGEKKKFNDYTVAELKKLSEIFSSISF